MKITAVRMARLLSLTDLFPFLSFSLYTLRSADDVNGEKKEVSRRGRRLSFITTRERRSSYVHRYVHAYEKQ
jgi:hypothetical protein